MQAIETKYICPTDFKGARVKAECAAKRRYYSWDHSLDTEGNHVAAAKQLANELEWQNAISSGTLKNGNWVHVLMPKKAVQP